MPKKVFVSYSHDSQEHKDRVLMLSDKLRDSGIDSIIDQYFESPEEGWPKWMLECIESSDFVLVICTPEYKRKSLKNEELGKGVKFETLLNYNYIYGNNSLNRKFIPVIMEDSARDCILAPLQGATYYNVSDKLDFAKLYRRITDQPLISMPELGKEDSLPTGLNLKNKPNSGSNMSDKSTTMVDIELIINQDFERFTEDEQIKLLKAIQGILGTNKSLLIKNKRKGSVILTIQMSLEDAEAISVAIMKDLLKEQGVVASFILGGTDNDKHRESMTPLPVSTLDSFDYYFAQGLAYHELGAYEAAETFYKKALNVNRNVAKLYNNIGNLLSLQKKLEMALAFYEKAISLDSSVAEFYYNRGLCNQQRQYYGNAIADYRKAIGLKSGYVGAINNLGNCFFEMGDYYQAIDYYAKALKLSSDLAMAKFNMGNAYFKLGNFLVAIKKYDAAINSNPKHGESLFNRAMAKALLGEFPEASLDMERASQLSVVDAEKWLDAFLKGELIINVKDKSDSTEPPFNSFPSYSYYSYPTSEEETEEEAEKEAPPKKVIIRRPKS